MTARRARRAPDISWLSPARVRRSDPDSFLLRAVFERWIVTQQSPRGDEDEVIVERPARGGAARQRGSESAFREHDRPRAAASRTSRRQALAPLAICLMWS